MTTRREFLAQSAAPAAGVALGLGTAVAAVVDDLPAGLVVDTHQHLWDLDRQKLPWLGSAPDVLRRSYVTRDYLAATTGVRIRAVYMEVDVDPAQHLDEAGIVVGLARDPAAPTVAAVVGGRPASPEFSKYLDRLQESKEIRGIRKVLHNDDDPRGQCLQDDFVRGVRELGRRGLSFDLCMRPTDLGDACQLTELCPDTRFVLDHCGNGDIAAFQANPATAPSHKADDWRRGIDQLAKRENVICKISGIIARARPGWEAGDLAPIVNHCLDAFGPDRVVFGGDWPVCLLGAPLLDWIKALHQIIRSRPAEQQQKLWSGNAIKFYALEGRINP